MWVKTTHDETLIPHFLASVALTAGLVFAFGPVYGLEKSGLWSGSVNAQSVRALLINFLRDYNESHNHCISAFLGTILIAEFFFIWFAVLSFRASKHFVRNRLQHYKLLPSRDQIWDRAVIEMYERYLRNPRKFKGPDQYGERPNNQDDMYIFFCISFGFFFSVVCLLSVLTRNYNILDVLELLQLICSEALSFRDSSFWIHISTILALQMTYVMLIFHLTTWIVNGVGRRLGYNPDEPDEIFVAAIALYSLNSRRIMSSFQRRHQQNEDGEWDHFDLTDTEDEVPPRARG